MFPKAAVTPRVLRTRSARTRGCYASTRDTNGTRQQAAADAIFDAKYPKGDVDDVDMIERGIVDGYNADGYHIK